MPRVTVGPKTGGGWQVTGEQQQFRTQAEAEAAARRVLQQSGGGARRQGTRRGSPAPEHDRPTGPASVDRIGIKSPAASRPPRVWVAEEWDLDAFPA